MKLSDMLTYTASEFLDDRTVLVSGDPDQLWSDEYLVRQFNEAQRRLCRRAWALIDTGVAPAGIITLVTDKATYTVHKNVLYVFDAQPSTQSYPLGRTTDDTIKNLTNTGGFSAFEIGTAASLAAAASGTTLAIATDAGSRTVRVSPTPTSTENGTVISLKVARLPTKDLTLDDTDASPEVDEQWHLAICEFAAGKALTLPNVDAEQKPEGRRLLEEFKETVRLARQERVRAEFSGSRWGFSSTTAMCGR